MNSKYFFGILLILLGFAFLLDQFNVMLFSEFTSTWWPLAVIAFGIFIISQNRQSLFPGIMIFAVGILLQLDQLEWLRGGFWAAFWPTLLIIFGIWMLLMRPKRKHKNEQGRKVPHHGDISNAFSSSNEIIDSEDLDGREISCAFGSVDVVIRDTGRRPQKPRITLNCAFAEVNLRIPLNWTIKVNGQPFLGEFKNQVAPVIEDDEIHPVLYIDYSLAFGSVKVYN
ncbi:MAG: LiaF transmembrane domain-containing protein [Candidatus Kapaibacterium sp.]